MLISRESEDQIKSIDTIMLLKPKTNNGNNVMPPRSAKENVGTRGNDITSSRVVNMTINNNDTSVTAKATAAALSKAKEIMLAGGTQEEAAAAAKEVARRILREDMAQNNTKSSTIVTYSGGGGGGGGSRSMASSSYISHTNQSTSTPYSQVTKRSVLSQHSREAADATVSRLAMRQPNNTNKKNGLPPLGPTTTAVGGGVAPPTKGTKKGESPLK